MTRKTTEQRKKERLCLRELLRQAGMREGMLELHEYLRLHPGYHTSHFLADHFDVVIDTVFRWANVLVEKGYAERLHSDGITDPGGEGGRYPVEFKVRGRVSLKTQYTKLAETAARKLTLKVGLR